MKRMDFKKYMRISELSSLSRWQKLFIVISELSLLKLTENYLSIYFTLLVQAKLAYLVPLL